MDGTLKGQSRPIRVPIVYVYVYVYSTRISRLCGRTGRNVGTTRNSTESGRSLVQSRVAAGAKYGEFSSRENPTVSQRKSVDQNLTMPTVERPSISYVVFSQRLLSPHRDCCSSQRLWSPHINSSLLTETVISSQRL